MKALFRGSGSKKTVAFWAFCVWRRISRAVDQKASLLQQMQDFEFEMQEPPGSHSYDQITRAFCWKPPIVVLAMLDFIGIHHGEDDLIGSAQE